MTTPTAPAPALARAIAGARFALQVIHPGSPMLRVRYRAGIVVDPYGFPDWIPYARALVELPPVPGLGADEVRVLDVLTANETAGRTGDPLWTDAPRGATPPGWTWARLGGLARASAPLASAARRTALVPVELHGSYRHLGGVSTDRIGGRRGLGPVTGAPPGLLVDARLAEDAVAAVEHRLGYPIPTAYRRFLARTNGGRPAGPAVHPSFGCVVDQPFFGLARQDWMQDLPYANGWFGDRLTADWLGIGYVQGGLIALKVRGGDAGSVWYLDDDDPRDRDGMTAAEVCASLLYRVADDFDQFWLSLREVPAAMMAMAVQIAAEGRATVAVDPRGGTALPGSVRSR